MPKATAITVSKNLLQTRKLAYDATNYYLEGTFETSELIYHLSRFRKQYQDELKKLA
jgi:archaellum biogenesis ATPase FlaH